MSEEGQNPAAEPVNPEQTQAAQFEALQPDNAVAENSGGDPQFDLVMDIPVTISVEIGRTMMSIRNLLQMNQGSVVELDRLAGEALDVMVNGTLVAHGEVVVINDKFGIRLTDVITPAERLNKVK
jgi:flagellar motor switch protein FliN